MYDFCFTYPYGVVLALGGLMGYLSKGSTASLAGGTGTGVVLFLLAHISLRQYHQGKLWKLGTLLSLLISVILTGIMALRFQETKKFFPPGMTTILCGSMTLFYIWSLFWGPKPKKKETTT